MIPKIIHQTAPTDKSKWHPVWYNCQLSWKKNFPETQFKYTMWTDEQLENLVRVFYPQYWDLYQSFPFHIMKIDFAEYCILHRYGGLYVDMDMYCYQNFFEDIKDQDFVLLESCMPDEFIQNCMMASSPGSEFWIFCMDEIKRTFYNFPDNTDLHTPKKLDVSFYIKDTVCCYHLTRMALRYDKPVPLFPQNLYNPLCNTYSPFHKTKHMLTNTWGEDFIQANIDNMNTWGDKFGNLQEWFLHNYKDRADLDKDALGENV
jgi:hypothetical protein